MYILYSDESFKAKFEWFFGCLWKRMYAYTTWYKLFKRLLCLHTCHDRRMLFSALMKANNNVKQWVVMLNIYKDMHKTDENYFC